MSPLAKGATRRAGQSKAPSCRRTPKNHIPHHDWPRCDRFFTYFQSRGVPAKKIAGPFSFGADESFPLAKQPLENRGGFGSMNSMAASQAFELSRIHAYRFFHQGGD